MADTDENTEDSSTEESTSESTETVDDGAAMLESAIAKVAELQAVSDAKDAVIAELKARNYDLLVAAAGTPPVETVADQPSDDTSNLSLDDVL